jgi:hypothetical protein
MLIGINGVSEAGGRLRRLIGGVLGHGGVGANTQWRASRRRGVLGLEGDSSAIICAV